jgi:hypothetical protein
MTRRSAIAKFDAKRQMYDNACISQYDECQKNEMVCPPPRLEASNEFRWNEALPATGRAVLRTGRGRLKLNAAICGWFFPRGCP